MNNKRLNRGLNLLILGTAVLTGIIGHVGLSLAGIAVYLTGKELHL